MTSSIKKFKNLLPLPFAPRSSELTLDVYEIPKGATRKSTANISRPGNPLSRNTGATASSYKEDSRDISFLLQHEYRFYNDISKGIDWIMPSRPIKNLTSTEMVSINFSSLIFKRDYPITETDSWDDYLDELDDEI